MKHRRTCKEAQVLKVKEEIKPSATRGYCNCPVCNEVKRADKLLSHCLSKHKEEIALSMTPETRMALKDVSLPVLFGYQPYSNSRTGVRCLFGCLHCKKGSFIHTKRPDEFDASMRYLVSAHKDCIPHFKKYEDYFADVGKAEHTLLPFVCRKLTDKDLQKATGADTVLEVKEPSVDTFEASTRILDLKEENTRLKAELAEEKAKKLLSEKTKALLTGVVEPDEDLSEEDLIEECVRAYQSLLKRATSTNRKLNTAMETKEVIQDIFENIMDADPELLVRSCTKEQVEVLRTYLKRD